MLLDVSINVLNNAKAFLSVYSHNERREWVSFKYRLDLTVDKVRADVTFISVATGGQRGATAPQPALDSILRYAQIR